MTSILWLYFRAFLSSSSEFELRLEEKYLASSLNRAIIKIARASRVRVRAAARYVPSVNKTIVNKMIVNMYGVTMMIMKRLILNIYGVNVYGVNLYGVNMYGVNKLIMNMFVVNMHVDYVHVCC